MDCCIADGCAKPAEPNRKYCPGHRKREKQGRPVEAKPLREWGTDPGEYLAMKALDLAKFRDDEDERGFRLALKRLKWAALMFVQKSKRQKVPKTPKTDG